MSGSTTCSELKDAVHDYDGVGYPIAEVCIRVSVAGVGCGWAVKDGAGSVGMRMRRWEILIIVL